VKQHLLIGLITLLVAVGCRSHPTSPYTAVPANEFVKQWEADLTLNHRDEIAALHVIGDTLIAYTKDNHGYWLSASGGQLLAINKIAPRDLELHPPVMLTDSVAIPTTSSIETYDKAGKHLASFATVGAVQSDAAASGNSVFIGVSHPGSGRVTRFDIAPNFDVNWELWVPVGIASGPAVFGDSVFAADINGEVWAVSLARDALWNLPDNVFKTNATITADLAADDFGVYVPSQDKKLYCLERGTGKIKWSYYAGMPLVDQPVVIGGVVYQLVPGTGLAAISKTDGKIARDAMWVQPIAKQVLAADQQYLYVRVDRGAIVALDKATGAPKFRSSRQDFESFATNTTSSLIYAATKDGHVLAIRPVLRPGTVGEIVLFETPPSYMFD